MNSIIFKGACHKKLGLLLVFLCFLAAGCVSTFKPQVISCSYGFKGQLVADTNQRKESDNFSILPPSGKNWCMNEQSSNRINFLTNKFIGQFVEKFPSDKETAQQYWALAYNVKVKDTDLSTAQKVKLFMEKWFPGGATWERIDGQWHALVTSPSDDHKLTKSEIEIDNTYGDDCVRYSASWFEKHSSRYRGPLVHKEEGFACRHPSSTDLLVVVKFHETHRAGYENTRLALKYRAEAEQTLQSLEFNMKQ